MMTSAFAVSSASLRGHDMIIMVCHGGDVRVFKTISISGNDISDNLDLFNIKLYEKVITNEHTDTNVWNDNPVYDLYFL